MKNCTLYFAYGSNMWLEQMNKRCPDNIVLGIARLRKHRWIISERGYANVVRNKKAQVLGTLFIISEEDETTLDRYEGVANGSYNKVQLTVHYKGKQVQALVYIDPITAEGVAKEEYVKRINAGIKDAELDERYVNTCIRKSIPNFV